MLVGIAVHADRSVRQIAEHAAAILHGDSSLPSAAQRMAQLRPLRGMSKAETQSAYYDDAVALLESCSITTEGVQLDPEL